MDGPLRRSHAHRLASGRGKRSRRRGTATLEAIIALPFFALIMAALMHVGGRAHERQGMADEARACAFLYASRGCTKAEALPARCQQLLGHLDAVEAEPVALGDVVDEPLPPDVLRTVLDLPVLGDVVADLVGRPVRVQQSTERPLPDLLGGGTLRLEAHQDVLCSDVPSQADLPTTLFEKLSPFRAP